jgi:recombination protein RecA
MERYQPKKKRRGNDYFPDAGDELSFIHSGSALLDCVLGGGWALGRVANIVGDKSTGKTLLAIEACANFARQYPDGQIYYREAEAAFDKGYAVKLGLPVDRVDFGAEGLDTIWDTIEAIFADLREKLDELERSGGTGLYIVDSLDALSSEPELARKVGEGSYGVEKAKMLGQIFRELVRRIRATKMAILIISQVRDKIGFVVGEKHKRSGGRALDFYASHALWLSHLKTLTTTTRGVKMATAIRVQANCKKNKIAMPFRKCQFTIRFGYGIEDVEASLDWLGEIKRLDALDLKANGVDAYLSKMDDMALEEQIKLREQVREVVMQVWSEVEESLLPKKGKYV